MQEDVDAEWGEGDEMHHYIQEEPTRVVSLPTLTRYRTFAHAMEHEPVRIGRAAQDFFVHKRRRYRDSGCDAAAQPYACVLPRSVNDPFDVATRQMDAFVWLTAQTRSAGEIVARFAHDRKVGVTPSQACLNRALQNLGSSGDVDCLLDIIEDAAMDSGRLALSTVLMAIRALHTQPVRAARLALSLQGTLPANATLPLATWNDMGSALARYAQRLPKPLDEHFMELLDTTIDAVREQSDTLSETILVDYGSCLLASKRPLSAAVRLVGEELLTGRNRTDSSNESEGQGNQEEDAALPLGAFLTDLLVALCTPFHHPSARRATGARCGTTDAGSATTLHNSSAAAEAFAGIGVSGVGELITFCGDVVKYAYARKIRLAPKAFDAVLALCDDAGDYHRLCVLFVAMCVLSVPTLRSTLRVVEVLNDVPALQSRMTELLGHTPQATVVWCLRRFGSVIAHHPHYTAKEEEALVALCAAVGTLLVTPLPPRPGTKVSLVGSPSPPGGVASAALTTTSASQVHEVAVLLLAECASPRYAAALLSSVIHHIRQAGGVGRQVTAAPATALCPTRELLRALGPLNEVALKGLLGEDGVRGAAAAAPEAAPNVARSHPLFEEAVKHDGGGYVDGAIKLVLPTPQTYCNVLDTSAINLLAAHPQAEAAFTKMMAGYMSKTGAVAVFPVELLASSFAATDAARTLVRTWRHTHAGWFTALPLSLSLQLSGPSDVSITADFFLRVRRTGHQKVALMTGKAENAEEAKRLGVQPAIFLPDLLEKLGVQLRQ